MAPVVPIQLKQKSPHPPSAPLPPPIPSPLILPPPTPPPSTLHPPSVVAVVEAEVQHVLPVLGLDLLQQFRRQGSDGGPEAVPLLLPQLPPPGPGGSEGLHHAPAQLLRGHGSGGGLGEGGVLGEVSVLLEGVPQPAGQVDVPEAGLVEAAHRLGVDAVKVVDDEGGQLLLRLLFLVHVLWWWTGRGGGGGGGWGGGGGGGWGGGARGGGGGGGGGWGGGAGGGGWEEEMVQR